MPMNLNLNLDKLQSDLIAWNSEYNSGGTYWNVQEAMAGNNETVKAELVKIFTEDTKTCFQRI